MRIANLLTSLALILSTVTLSGAQSCVPLGKVQQVRAQVSDCCCAPARCDCHHHCYDAAEQPSEASVAALAATDVLSLLALAVAVTDAGTPLSPDPTVQAVLETVGPFASRQYACLGTRAPPSY